MAKPRKRTPKSPPRRSRALRLALAGGVLVVVFTGWWWWHQSRSKEKTGIPNVSNAATPLWEDERTVFAQYGHSTSCRDCHQEAFKLWGKSNHALAERPVEAERERVAFNPPRSIKHGTQRTEVSWTNSAPEMMST